MKKAILNIGAGRSKPLNLPNDPYFLVNLDRMYKGYGIEDLAEVALQQNSFMDDTPSFPKTLYVNFDIYSFLQNYPLTFDTIVIYRFLEHVPMFNVLEFVYFVGSILKKGGTVDIIVPNYNLLAERLLNIDTESKDFDSDYLLVNMEMVAEPSDPHGFVTTPKIVKKFFETEKIFKSVLQIANFTFDNRPIYCRSIFEKL